MTLFTLAHASSDVLFVKYANPARFVVGSPFRKLLPLTAAPAVQLQFPLTTERNSIPASIRRKFRSVIGDDSPENVCDKFQFSSRPSTKTSTTRSDWFPTGKLNEANARRFSGSHRASELKLIARCPMLYHSG